MGEGWGWICSYGNFIYFILNAFLSAEAVTLGCFWLAFLGELPKMLSIMFKVLTSDDMQGDTSDTLRFLFKY